MKRALYVVGRSLEVLGLLVLPSAIWAGQIGHDERGAISLFLGSVLIFYVGYFLIGLAGK